MFLLFSDLFEKLNHGIDMFQNEEHSTEQLSSNRRKHRVDDGNDTSEN